MTETPLLARPSRLVAPATALVAALVAASAGAQTKLGPVFKDGMVQVVPEFADTTRYIRQRLWVETDFDSDRDGKKDRIHVDLVRPGAADAAGLKVPVIMQSSPYFGGTNGPRENLWNVKQEVGADQGTRVSAPEKAFNPAPKPIGGLTQWVGRGFAVVSSEQPGSGLSTGCPTVGDYYETTAPKFVIDWLNGRAKGYTSVDGTEEVSAASWTTGKVGMIGTSYNGTLPLSAALTGVAGLEAIVPVSPNTSYYHYYRSNGLVRSPGGWLGEDIDFLYDYIHSGRVREACNTIWRDGLFMQFRDRAHGDLNDEWAKRDQLPLIKNVKAAVLFAHGFNDWNVVPEHTIRMWNALKGINSKAKLYMHQGGHGGDPPSDLINRWWTHYLYGVDNGVEKEPRVLIVPSNAAGGAMGTPMPFTDYPIPGSAPVRVHLARGGSAVGGLSITAAPKQGTESLTDDAQFNSTTLGQMASSSNRLIYATPTLLDTVHLSGTATVTLKLALSKPAGNLSVYLVSLPWVSGSGQGRGGRGRGGRGGAADTAAATTPPAPVVLPRGGLITRGWADPQNWKSLTKSGNYDSKLPGVPLVPGQFVTLTFDLQPDDQIIPPGQQIGLMIMSTDPEFTLSPQAGTVMTIDLDGTSIVLPVVGGQAALKKAVGGK